MADVNVKRTNFVKQLIKQDLETGKYTEVITRFPPEPNGYLHIGHAKSICLNFGLILEFGGRCYLRFDDTNPIKEEEEFVRAIIADVEWLGFKWDALTHSSDYYQELYDFAVNLINQNKAYVDSLTMEEIRDYRGNLQTGGRDSPFRNRSVAENLELFAKMRAGAFADGSHVLRAKIDMQSPNLNLRDPVLYRIRHVAHQRTKNEWCIYPMYDYAHPISDALEKITHSLCTLEFQDHRPLYNWFINNLPVPAKPEQTEFARLNVSHTVTSKRKLKDLVTEKVVDGWDDPRMPTLQGMRKRGYPPLAIRNFCELIGVSRSDSVIDMGILEEAVREVLNHTAKRAMCILEPLKVIIDNYPDNQIEQLVASLYPQQADKNVETRILPFSRELYIERSDFMAEAPKNYFRLTVGSEVRLRNAYVIRCNRAVYDENGQVAVLHCSYDQDTLGKNPPDRKVKGVIHWVSCAEAAKVEIIQYDRLFTVADPGNCENFMEFINPDSYRKQEAFCEPSLLNQPLGETFQFERTGYYLVQNCVNNKVTTFQQIVTLKDTWGKIAASL